MLLDLLRFAIIQRDSVLFWMHVCLKNGNALLLRMAAELTGHKTRAAQRFCCATPRAFECVNYAIPRVVSVGLSIVEVTARPLSAWYAASAARVSGPITPSAAPT